MGSLRLSNCVETLGYDNLNLQNALGNAKALQLVCQTAAKRLGYMSYTDYLMRNPEKRFSFPESESEPESDSEYDFYSSDSD